MNLNEFPNIFNGKIKAKCNKNSGKIDVMSDFSIQKRTEIVLFHLLQLVLFILCYCKIVKISKAGV